FDALSVRAHYRFELPREIRWDRFLIDGTCGDLLPWRPPMEERLADASSFFILASFPLVSWVFRNLWLCGNAVKPTLGVYPPAIKDLLPSIDTMSLWLFPEGIVDSAPWLWRSILAIVFLTLYWLAQKGDLSRSGDIHFVGFFLFWYGGVFLLSFSLNAQPLYFDTRTLALPYVAIMILTVSITTNWLKATRLE